LKVHAYYSHVSPGEQRRMAAPPGPRRFDHAIIDAALVAPESDVTKPDVRSRLAGTPPTGVDAEGLCEIPMLSSDIDLCSWA
jgi:hypothetical protein